MTHLIAEEVRQGELEKEEALLLFQSMDCMKEELYEKAKEMNFYSLLVNEPWWLSHSEIDSLSTAEIVFDYIIPRVKTQQAIERKMKEHRM